MYVMENGAQGEDSATKKSQPQHWQHQGTSRYRCERQRCLENSSMDQCQSWKTPNEEKQESRVENCCRVDWGVGWMAVSPADRGRCVFKVLEIRRRRGIKRRYSNLWKRLIHSDNLTWEGKIGGEQREISILDALGRWMNIANVLDTSLVEVQE
ncbi:hypothetical protein Tco_0837006 [Tanacetum coccineum]